MRKLTKVLVPRNADLSEAMKKANEKSFVLFSRSRTGGKRPIYPPTEKTKAKMKAKITLPKFNLPP